MLADVYQIQQEEEKRPAQKRKNGVLKLKVSLEASKTAKGVRISLYSLTADNNRLVTVQSLD